MAPAHVPPVEHRDGTLDRPKHTALISTARACEAARDRARAARRRPHWARRALESASIRARSRWTGCAQRCISALETLPATPTTPPLWHFHAWWCTAMAALAAHKSLVLDAAEAANLQRHTGKAGKAGILRMSWRVPRREENKWMDKRLWGRGCPYSAVALCQIRVLAVGERVRVEAA